MEQKFYSFESYAQASAIKKAIKKLFKKDLVTLNDFESTICSLCPYNCKTCTFCWNMFYRFKEDKKTFDYKAPLTLFKTLISAYYDQLYMPTFYYLKENICTICKSYGKPCNSITMSDICPSRYLTQMNTDENTRGLYNTPLNDDNLENKKWFDIYGQAGYDDYDYVNGYGNRYSSPRQTSDFLKNTKPMLSINGTKMFEIINKLWKPTETENRHA